MTGVAKNTVVKLLTEIGTACEQYQDRVLRDLTCKRVQCDEVWSFCYAKQKNVSSREARTVRLWRRLDVDGDCADSKLI